jgi:hypothetical protein
LNALPNANQIYTSPGWFLIRDKVMQQTGKPLKSDSLTYEGGRWYAYSTRGDKVDVTTIMDTPGLGSGNAFMPVEIQFGAAIGGEYRQRVMQQAKQVAEKLVSTQESIMRAGPTGYSPPGPSSWP